MGYELGDLFQFFYVFVPFLGDFLSIGMKSNILDKIKGKVFVPFLGDFLSI